MTVRWTVRAANDRSRDRAARVESVYQLQIKRDHPQGWSLLIFNM